MDATIRQHTKRDKALRNIDLVENSYALESNLLETQGQMAAILEQNQMLQHHLAAQDNSQILSFPDSTQLTIARHRDALAHFSQGGDIPRVLPMEHASHKRKDDYKDEPSCIRGGGNCQVGCNAAVSVGSRSDFGYMGDVHYVNDMDVFGSLSTISPPTMSPLPVSRHIEQTTGLPAQGIHILGVVQGNAAPPTSLLGAIYAPTLERHSQDVAHTFSPPSQQNHAASPCKSNGRCQFGRGGPYDVPFDPFCRNGWQY